MVSIPYINPDIGTILDISEIGKICHSKNVPVHVNFTQLIKVDVIRCNIDIVTLQVFDVFVMIVSKDVLRGYRVNMLPIHFGRSRWGQMAIQSSLTEYIDYMSNRRSKNKNLHMIRQNIVDELSRRIPSNESSTLLLYILGPATNDKHLFVPGILAISIIKTKGLSLSMSKMCTENDKYQIDLGQGGYNKYTQSSSITHTMPIHEQAKKNTLIIRMKDTMTMKDAKTCVRDLMNKINDQLDDV